MWYWLNHPPKVDTYIKIWDWQHIRNTPNIVESFCFFTVTDFRIFAGATVRSVVVWAMGREWCTYRDVGESWMLLSIKTPSLLGTPPPSMHGSESPRKKYSEGKRKETNGGQQATRNTILPARKEMCKKFCLGDSFVRKSRKVTMSICMEINAGSLWGRHRRQPWHLR